jgi:hypothetical protein
MVLHQKGIRASSASLSAAEIYLLPVVSGMLLQVIVILCYFTITVFD